MNKYNTIDEYISSFPENTKNILENIKHTYKKIAPECDEYFGYGVPAIKINNKNIIYFAAFKNHIGIYPSPSTIIFFKNKLKEYKTAEGTIQFPINNDFPYNLLEEIIKHNIKKQYLNY